MDDKFCQALADNDRKCLKNIFDEKLKTLNPKNSLEDNYKEIKVWIEAYECVEKVEPNPDLLDSEPPIKEFIITLQKSSGKAEIRSVGIKILGNKMRFDL